MSHVPSDTWHVAPPPQGTDSVIHGGGGGAESKVGRSPGIEASRDV